MRRQDLTYHQRHRRHRGRSRTPITPLSHVTDPPFQAKLEPEEAHRLIRCPATIPRGRLLLRREQKAYPVRQSKARSNEAGAIGEPGLIQVQRGKHYYAMADHLHSRASKLIMFRNDFFVPSNASGAFWSCRSFHVPKEEDSCTAVLAAHTYLWKEVLAQPDRSLASQRQVQDSITVRRTGLEGGLEKTEWDLISYSFPILSHSILFKIP